MRDTAVGLLTWAMMTTTGAQAASNNAQIAPSGVQIGQYQADLTTLSSQPRNPGSEGWQRAQTMVAERFAALGYEVERHAYGAEKADGTAYGVNILGTLWGRSKPDEIIVVSAHYDSNPDQCGADDNASGVAGVLAVAEAFANTKPERTLMVAIWDQEEVGLIGSNAWAQHARKRGLNIQHAYVYEMIGYRDTRPNTQRMPKGLEWLYPAAKRYLEERDFAGDSIVLVGTDAALMQDFAQAADLHDLPTLPLHVWWRLRNLCPRDLRRSDHDAFWRNGYQATMITDSANFRNPYYHSVRDSIETIDIAFACAVVQTTISTLQRRLNAL
jgi:Zn-dependent M28 family amino/carboxypeptidase